MCTHTAISIFTLSSALCKTLILFCLVTSLLHILMFISWLSHCNTTLIMCFLSSWNAIHHSLKYVSCSTFAILNNTLFLFSIVFSSNHPLFIHTYYLELFLVLLFHNLQYISFSHMTSWSFYNTSSSNSLSYYCNILFHARSTSYTSQLCMYTMLYIDCTSLAYAPQLMSIVSHSQIYTIISYNLRHHHFPFHPHLSVNISYKLFTYMHESFHKRFFSHNCSISYSLHNRNSDPP